ncbi:MAG: acyltransferase family protein [Parvularculaceae bacterium]
MAIVETKKGAFTGQTERRYDLDWLRVVAFGLLISYHVGMFYVTWDWHVKSVYAGPAVEPLMTIVNPWRLALLFFISGVAVRFASDKASSIRAFAGSRAYRLALPILAGAIIIVAPQSYFELRQASVIEPHYLEFWRNYLKLEQFYSMITPTWNHLWYVVYLLVYIVLIAPLLPALRRFAEGTGANWLAAATGGPARLLLLVIVPFILYKAFLSPIFPTTHDLVNDWANHAHRFTVFMLGYFVAKNPRFWRSVDKTLPFAAGLVFLIGGGLQYLRSYPVDFHILPFDGPAMIVLHTLYAWSFIVMLLALAQRYLNYQSKLLTYLTGAVFCYYILHQTIIVIAGYYLTRLKLGVWPEFLAVTLATVIGCAAGYEIARRIPFLRPWLGIKNDKARFTKPRRLVAALEV